MQQVFCDWGTSSLRGYLLDDSKIIQKYSSDLGLLKAQKIGYEKVLDSVLDSFQCEPDIPIYLSGMIGSKQGWAEAPYVPTPVGLEQMKGKTIKPAKNIHIIGGVSHLDGSGNYDVMRGEEVQVFGILEQEPAASLICLPGSHSKWVKIEAGQIKSFSTWMTGELFKSLSENTIFTTQIDSKTWNKEAFVQGVEFAREHNDLGSSLFKLRTEYLFERSDKEHFHSYLSGFLIGSEIREAIGVAKEVSLCGSDTLMNSYALALEVFGAESKQFPSDTATIRGIEKICGGRNE